MKLIIAVGLLTLVSALPTSTSTTNLRLPLADISLRAAQSFALLQTALKTSDQTSLIASGDFGATTQNAIKYGECKQMTILFARGTIEQGNVGTLVGPPFFQAVGTAIGATNVAVQGIDYPADISGFLAGGDAAGSKLMAQMVGQVMAACPMTNLVLSGYSQGAQLVHNAASMLDAAQTAFVKSTVIFGDPDDGSAVGSIPAADTLVVCHKTDLICAHTVVVLTPHLTYAKDAGTAAAFVVANMGRVSRVAVKRVVDVEMPRRRRLRR